MFTKCPCLSDLEYKDCCGLFHRGERDAATAEELMRSRYSAYAMQEIDYLIETTSPSQRKYHDRESLQTWAEDTKWKKLEIVETREGTSEDSKGHVEFIAYYEENKKDKIHHELSLFKKIKGKWYYHNGRMLANQTMIREQPKVGRNDPCPCGSGKKYKKCCGRKGEGY